MPRDGSQQYYRPFPDVIEGTTIESVVYNGFTDDVKNDLNAARPIIAGGTGATSADGALTNLSAEKAGQLVSNFDSHTWLAGSFYSLAAATGAPNAHAFYGVVYMAGSNDIVVEARDQVDGALYVRRKVAGVWGAWVDTATALTSEISAAVAPKVNRAGDTMTGVLAVPGEFKVTGDGNLIRMRASDYSLILNNNAGQSSFLLTNNGTPDGAANALRPITINNATGAVTIPNLVVSAVGVTNGTLITDYNSIPAMGPIYSTATGTTNSPAAGHAFNGIVYGQDLNNLVVELRDLTAYIAGTTAPAWFGGPPTQAYEVGTLALDVADNTTWVVTNFHLINYTGTFASARASVVPGCWALSTTSVQPWVPAPPTRFIENGSLWRDTADNTIWMALGSMVMNYTGTFAAFRTFMGGTAFSLVNPLTVRYTRVRMGGVWGVWATL
jgi:hypothetical protein